MQQDKAHLTSGEKRLAFGAGLTTLGTLLLPYGETHAGAGLAIVLVPVCWALIVTGLMLWARGAFIRGSEITEEM